MSSVECSPFTGVTAAAGTGRAVLTEEWRPQREHSLGAANVLSVSARQAVNRSLSRIRSVFSFDAVSAYMLHYLFNTKTCIFP